MESTTAISGIIRKISKDDASMPINTQSAMIVTYKRANRKIVQQEKRSLFDFGRSERNMDYYMVTFQLPVRIHCKGVVISDMISNLSLELDVLCDLHFQSRSQSDQQFLARLETFIGLAAYSDGNLQMALENMVTSTITHAARSADDTETFIRKFYEEGRARLNREVLVALEQSGFTAVVSVYPTFEKSATENKSISEQERLSARTKDYDKALDISFSYELALDSQYTINAILQRNRRGEMTDLLKEHIRNSVGNFTLTEFLTDLDDGVRRHIATQAAVDMARFGYKISHLSLKCSPVGLPLVKNVELEHNVACTIRKYDSKITVTNRIRLQIENHGKFLNKGITDVVAWVKSQLDTICASRLFNQTYLDIIFDHERPENDRLETQIRSDLADAAVRVGLSIQQHFILPMLKPLKLKDEGFRIDIVKEYATKTPEIKVPIQLLVFGKIENLRKVEKYLESQVDLEQRITEAALEALKAKLHNTDTGKALAFNIGARDEMTCEQEVSAAVMAALKEFSVENPEITLKAEETEIHRRQKALSRGTHSLQLEVKARIEAATDEMFAPVDIELIGFTIEYQIKYVEPSLWYVFHNNKRDTIEEEIAALEDTIRYDLVEKLQTMPISKLRYTSFLTAQRIQTEIIHPVKAKIRTVYGLNLEIVNIVRNTTYWEGKMLEAGKISADARVSGWLQASKIGVDSRQAELKALYELRKELIDYNDGVENEEAIKALDEQIKEISGEIPSFSLRPAHPQGQDPDKDEEFSYDDFKPIAPTAQPKTIAEAPSTPDNHEPA